MQKELYNALKVINKYIGAEVYEICNISNTQNGCMGNYCVNCCNLWKTKLSYNNLSKVGISIFFTKDEAKERLKIIYNK